MEEAGTDARFQARYRDGYYVVIDTETGKVIPPEPGHYKKYRDGYLWDSAAVSEARRLEERNTRLEYLRGELRAERISWGELAELQSLAEHIDPGDVELLEAAGVPEHPDEPEPEPMLDTLASNARTALDDPMGLDWPEIIPGVVAPSNAQREAYVIDRMDEIIGLLNPSDETRESFAATLTILGRHLAERADVMESVDADEASGDRAAYVNAAALVHRALDVLDEAIVELQPSDGGPLVTVTRTAAEPEDFPGIPAGDADAYEAEVAAAESDGLTEQ